MVSYFAFQVERLSRKELAERRQVTSDESIGRSAIGSASLLTWELIPSTQTSHSTIRRFDPIALPSLPPLAAHERSEIVSRMNTNSSSSSHNVVELEKNARADILDWEHQARGAIERSLSLSVAPRVAAQLTAEEALWRNKLEKSAHHDYKQFHVLQTQTLVFLLQHPQYSGSCYAARREVRRQETAARWELAIQFCGLFHSWEEEWGRLTLRLSQQLQRQALREREQLCRREVVEFGAIVALGRPIIDELLEMQSERQKVWEHDVERLTNLHALRREVIAKIHDRMTNKEDYILEEKMHLVERILSTQEDLLEEVVVHDSDANSFERLHGHYLQDRPWITDPSTPFGELLAYQKTITTLRQKNHNGNSAETSIELPSASLPSSSSSLAAMRWTADVPWESPNRHRSLQHLSQQSVTAQETWKQYAQDHYQTIQFDELSSSGASSLRINGPLLLRESLTTRATTDTADVQSAAARGSLQSNR